MQICDDAIVQSRRIWRLRDAYGDRDVNARCQMHCSIAVGRPSRVGRV